MAAQILTDASAFIVDAAQDVHLGNALTTVAGDAAQSLVFSDKKRILDEFLPVIEEQADLERKRTGVQLVPGSFSQNKYFPKSSNSLKDLVRFLFQNDSLLYNHNGRTTCDIVDNAGNPAQAQQTFAAFIAYIQSNNFSMNDSLNYYVDDQNKPYGRYVMPPFLTSTNGGVLVAGPYSGGVSVVNTLSGSLSDLGQRMVTDQRDIDNLRAFPFTTSKGFTDWRTPENNLMWERVKLKSGARQDVEKRIMQPFEHEPHFFCFIFTGGGEDQHKIPYDPSNFKLPGGSYIVARAPDGAVVYVDSSNRILSSWSVGTYFKPSDRNPIPLRMINANAVAAATYTALQGAIGAGTIGEENRNLAVQLASYVETMRMVGLAQAPPMMVGGGNHMNHMNHATKYKSTKSKSSKNKQTRNKNKNMKRKQRAKSMLKSVKRSFYRRRTIKKH